MLKRRRLDETQKNPHWWRTLQMPPVWLEMHKIRRLEDTWKNPHCLVINHSDTPSVTTNAQDQAIWNNMKVHTLGINYSAFYTSETAKAQQPNRVHGRSVLIPRIPLCPGDSPIQFKRLQYPQCVSFAMTVNKSQGQILKVAGLNLDPPAFSHGRFYVSVRPLYLYTYKKNKKYCLSSSY